MTDSQNPVLAIDIGGTKVAVAAISTKGKILERVQIHTDLSKGVDEFVNSIADASKSIANRLNCQIVGVGSAGPLDPVHGNLINPTNMKSAGNDMECFPLVKHLKSSLELEVVLENDAAAAILGETWLGEAKDCESAMIMTLGTGVGIGVVSQGKLGRLRQSYHPEASHISLNFLDKDALCGCGNYGCVEAYLGGKNFVSYAKKKWSLNIESGQQLVQLAKENNPSAVAAFDFYSEVMAQALNAYAVLFAPEVVVFSGGFSHAYELFAEKAKARLEVLLKDRRVGLDFMPRLALSQQQEDMGLLGAARIALNYPNRF